MLLSQFTPENDKKPSQPQPKFNFLVTVTYNSLFSPRYNTLKLIKTYNKVQIKSQN